VSRWITVLCLLWISTAVWATTPLLPEQQRVPGGVAILEIGVEQQPRPEVRYKRKNVLTLQHQGKWLAIVGIPLSSEPGKHDVHVRAPGSTDWRSLSFTVEPRDYPEQRLTVPNKRHVNPNDEDMARIKRERTVIANAKSRWTDTQVATRFRLPVSGIRSSEFGLKRFFNDQPRRPHGGIDIAASGGTPIYAPADGVVIETGDFFFSGNCIFIDHGQGLLTFYAHLSHIDVVPGQTLKVGEKIGEVGQTGRSTGDHLHWSVGLNQTWVNPDLFLDAP